ncbi:hypothetical protein ACKWTF_015685 [Chironomus riparius]
MKKISLCVTIRENSKVSPLKCCTTLEKITSLIKNTFALCDGTNKVSIQKCNTTLKCFINSFKKSNLTSKQKKTISKPSTNPNHQVLNFITLKTFIPLFKSTISFNIILHQSIFFFSSFSYSNPTVDTQKESRKCKQKCRKYSL